MCRLIPSLFCIVVWLAPRPAHAETPKATLERQAGVAIVLVSLAAGAALTAYGLGIECGDQDHACHRRASLPIWSGIGVAGAGSVLGLTIMGRAEQRRSAVLVVSARFD
jgi:hypothetical protein